jgi:hypothetical protein
MKTGQLLSTFHRNDAPITSVDFSPTDDSVASASDDDTVKIWLAISQSKVNQGIATPIKRADYFAELENWEKAKQVLAESIKLNTQSPELMVARGRLDVHQGEKQSAAALADYTRAIHLRPEHGMLFKHRVDLHFQLSHCLGGSLSE